MSGYTFESSFYDGEDEEYDDDQEERERERQLEQERLYYFNGTLIRRELRSYIRNRIARHKWEKEQVKIFKLSHDIPHREQVNLCLAQFEPAFYDLRLTPPPCYMAFSWRKCSLLVVNYKLLREHMKLSAAPASISSSGILDRLTDNFRTSQVSNNNEIRIHFLEREQ